MSVDEQDLAIGKMSRQRAGDRRQMAILAQEIKDRAADLSKGAAILMRGVPNLGEMETALVIIKEIHARGGLERLRDAIGEYAILHRREAELSVSLRDAGAE
jgi:hypothetical protein